MTDEILAQLRGDLFTQITYLKKSKGLCDKLDTDKIYSCIVNLTTAVEELNAELDTDDFKLFHDLEVEIGIYNLHIDREKMMVLSVLHYLGLDTDDCIISYDELAEQLQYIKEANSKLFEEGVNPKINMDSILNFNRKNRPTRDSIDSETIQDAKNELAIYSTKLDELKNKLLNCLYSVRFEIKQTPHQKGKVNIGWWKSKK